MNIYEAEAVEKKEKKSLPSRLINIDTPMIEEKKMTAFISDFDKMCLK